MRISVWKEKCEQDELQRVRVGKEGSGKHYPVPGLQLGTAFSTVVCSAYNYTACSVVCSMRYSADACD